ncbi:MAG: 6-carboxytetrahydropterin synthase QueD [Armatimonadetes bacterium]|nr:6-carboxytetrahydropterin synthase QueD [Armatimonadota bacterium]NIM23311.1 6-carboxytetrahydropterin synthase QueD [Armatimonadota bacterium]NIM67175.1 6-carboxytetrahydropterin synthase QueD [Armatimonadota bacterium]NIM75702.1 6-carboxytetrahydropterin synthase QueD [Armatimonadota bacterium]NIN05364.1 6-carboxytetrahydropterin synthase QueD [Armatimonadota bacterium]
MYEATVEADFSASHVLEGYDGPCGKLHGHNYRVQATIEGEKLDSLGMVLDLRILKRALASAIAPLDHTHLNDCPDFADTPPSAENVARYVFEKVSAALAEMRQETRSCPTVSLREVRVAESNHAWVTYRP